MPRRRILIAAVIAAAVLAPNAVGRPLPGFRSPTGNIRCFALVGHSGDLLCMIAQSQYAKALQARCIDGGQGVDWHGFVLGVSRKGALNCSGGIQYDPVADTPVTPTLAYGATWRNRTLTCASRITGVTCRTRNGHGLFVSRGSWR